MLKKYFITGFCLGVAIGAIYFLIDRKNETEVTISPVAFFKADTLSFPNVPISKEIPDYKYSDWIKINEKFDPKNERFLYYAQMNADQIKKELQRLNSAFSPDAPQYVDVGDYYDYEYLGVYYLVYRWASMAPREALNFQEKENIERCFRFSQKIENE